MNEGIESALTAFIKEYPDTDPRALLAICGVVLSCATGTPKEIAVTALGMINAALNAAAKDEV